MRALFYIFLVTSHFVYGADDSYHFFKDKINTLENSIIRDFEFQMPQESESGQPDLKQYQKAVTQIEIQYREQLSIFEKLENEFKSINQTLALKLNEGLLSESEVDRLKNSIEYANRIILRSRRDEIAKIYLKLKSKLSHIPKLKDIHKKILKLKQNNKCVLSNIFLDSKKGLLSFDVSSKSAKAGESINFMITQGDVSQGNITSDILRTENAETLKMITQFTSSYPTAKGTYSFTLTENQLGDISSAAFHQQNIKAPWVNLFGLELGSHFKNRDFWCQEEVELGPRPASTDS